MKTPATLRQKPAARSIRSWSWLPGGRTTLIVLSLAVVGLLQISMTWDKLALPFLDTRLHYNFDNALFSTYARDGNRLGDLRSQFGITSLQYTRWNEPSGSASYYTHHPFLLKALFQQYAKMFGVAEWVSRSFYLVVSFGIAAGLFALFLIETGSIAAAFMSSAILVNIPLFATFQTCVKFESDGLLIGIWLFVVAAKYLKDRRAAWLAALAALAVLVPLAHWTAVLFGVSAIAWLACEWGVRKKRHAGLAAAATVAGMLLGGLALISMFVWIKGGWSYFRTDITSAFAIRSDSSVIPVRAWLERQISFAQMNFGTGFLGVLALIVTAWFFYWIWTRKVGGSTPGRERSWTLPAFFICALAAASGWVFGFREGSFVHYFNQYGFMLPAAVLPAAAVASLHGSRKAFYAGVIAALILVAYLRTSSAGLYQETLAQQMGRVEDIEFLKSLRPDRFRRMLFVATDSQSFNSWFQGPLFEYYTGRPVVAFDGKDSPKSGDKLLILRYTEQARIVPQVEKHFKVRLTGEKCASRFCAYDVN